MEKYTIKQDIKIYCVTADSFPAGIQAAFDRLHAKLPTTEGRKFYGISRPDRSGTIVYKAGVEELFDSELASAGFEPFTIAGGDYISIYISDFMKHIPAIQQAFIQLVKQPGIDHEGYCVEIYEGQHDVRCMVKLK